MLTVGTLAIGAAAAFVVGVAKTGVPGIGIVAIPLFATVFDGRLIPGATLPILITADLFAVSWYRHHARWDVLRPLAGWIGLGYAAGIAFFVAVGSATRPLEIAIGAIVLLIVAIQIRRLRRGRDDVHAGPIVTAASGTGGGFTTFVANAAGPIINTYLVGIGLPKHQLMGTSAWLYLLVNLSKIPFYVALGELTDGGRFFTADGLLFDALMVPAVIAGVLGGRALFHRIPQEAFLLTVLVLSALGALNLLLPPF